MCNASRKSKERKQGRKGTKRAKERDGEGSQDQVEDDWEGGVAVL